MGLKGGSDYIKSFKYCDHAEIYESYVLPLIKQK